MANKLDYTQYDFQSLLVQITNILKNYNSWSDAFESSTGTVLLEFYAYVANMILYSIERTAEEVYIKTAQRYSSVVNLTSLLNYIPKRNVSATGNIVFSLLAVKSANVIIPKYTSLSTLGGYKYLTSQDTIIFTGQTSVTVPAIQGSLVTQQYTSAGGINQEFQLTSTKVENSNLFCVVNNTSWNKVTSFVNSTNGSTDFMLVQNLDGTITIKFGDNVNGKAPDNGNVITISYIESDGLIGSVYSSNNLTKINDTIYDVNSAVISDISVTNTTSILGGDDAESIEDIRNNAPRVFSTGDRFVTKYDGIAIISDYPSVASCNVWGEAENSPPNYSSFNTAYISMILQNWTIPNSDFKTTLSTYLYTKAPLTIKFTYVDPTIVNAYPVVSIYVKQGYSLASVQSAVQAILEDQFSLGVNSLIGTNIRYAKVISAIQAVDGVAYCYLTLNVYQALSPTSSLLTAWTGTLPLLTAKAGTVNLYNGDILIATDNGGTFTDVSSAYAVSGTINHTTGAIAVSISPAPSSTLNIRYEQNESGDLVVGHTQILEYFNSTITTQYA